MIAAVRSLATRATLVLLAFVAAGIMLMGAATYRELSAYTDENAMARILRAACAAATLFEMQFPGSVRVERDAAGDPLSIRLTGSEPLAARATAEVFDALLGRIGRTNRGASNLFSWNAEAQAFDRFATTFRLPDGSMPPAFSIGPSHPAHAALVQSSVFRGDVPVMGRMRFAYLTPVLFPGGDLAGVLAIDVGWSDDLVTGRERVKMTTLGLTAAILAFTATLGALLHWRLLAPVPALARVAHRIAEGGRGLAIPGRDRKDEIGDLAEGLDRVNVLSVELEILAYTDPLTGLGNRAHFRRELARVLHAGARARPTAIVLLDIDHFRALNEGFGTAVGDRLLREIGARLRIFCADANPLPARIGSDEFALLVRDQAPDQLDRLGAMVRSALQAPLKLEHGEIEVTVGMGLVSVPAHAAEPELADRRAHLALRVAKARGRGATACFDPALGARTRAELGLGLALRDALDRKRLVVHFQVQAGTNRPEVFGLEALARWPRGDGTMVPPSEFIPVAEEMGLIIELGSWVLEETCRIVRGWLDASVAVPHVSVNVSPAQLWQPGFVDAVRAVLERYRVPPHMICLEVTESLFVNLAEDRIRSVFEGLRAIGVRVALDDFGAGYSSLGYLNRIRFDQIKIDRSFIAGIDSDGGKQRVFEGIAAIGRGLRLEIVAEGAETRREVRYLMRAGCDAVQGAFFSPPCPAMLVPEEMAAVRKRLAELSEPAAEDDAPVQGPA